MLIIIVTSRFECFCFDFLAYERGSLHLGWVTTWGAGWPNSGQIQESSSVPHLHFYTSLKLSLTISISLLFFRLLMIFRSFSMKRLTFQRLTFWWTPPTWWTARRWTWNRRTWTKPWHSACGETWSKTQGFNLKLPGLDLKPFKLLYTKPLV